MGRTLRQAPIADVVKHRLCCGCGACAVACPEGAIRIVEGKRHNYALVDAKRCNSCGRCRSVCPSAELLDGGLLHRNQASGTSVRCYLGYALDESIRRQAASGGFITALLVHLLESGEIDGAIVARADEDRPFHNESFVARSAFDVRLSAGARYGPVSACAALQEVMDAPGRYAFVGKPCEVTALRNVQQAEPLLQERVVLAIGLFCAQTPARSRVTELLRSRGVHVAHVSRIQYRGRGWPGTFSAWNSDRLLCEMPYRSAWDFLASGLPALRCFLCPDGTAGGADLSVGDPWRVLEGTDIGLGRSLILARTPLGESVLRQAASGGRLSLEPAHGTWVRKRLHVQEEREATVRKRLTTYRAVFLGRLDVGALIAHRLASLPTMLRLRLRREYY